MAKQEKTALEQALDEVAGEIVNNSDPLRQQLEIDMVAVNTRLDLQDRTEKSASRKVWGRVLLGMVVAGFVASYLIIVAIGLGWLRYAENAFAVPSVVSAGVLGTYGLAKIAARYFFDDK